MTSFMNAPYMFVFSNPRLYARTMFEQLPGTEPERKKEREKKRKEERWKKKKNK